MPIPAQSLQFFKAFEPSDLINFFYCTANRRNNSDRGGFGRDWELTTNEA
jgi:hypothetical protein